MVSFGSSLDLGGSWKEPGGCTHKEVGELEGAGVPREGRAELLSCQWGQGAARTTQESSLAKALPLHHLPASMLLTLRKLRLTPSPTPQGLDTYLFDFSIFLQNLPTSSLENKRK